MIRSRNAPTASKLNTRMTKVAILFHHKVYNGVFFRHAQFTYNAVSLFFHVMRTSLRLMVTYGKHKQNAGQDRAVFTTISLDEAADNHRIWPCSCGVSQIILQDAQNFLRKANDDIELLLKDNNKTSHHQTHRKVSPLLLSLSAHSTTQLQLHILRLPSSSSLDHLLFSSSFCTSVFLTNTLAPAP